MQTATTAPALRWFRLGIASAFTAVFAWGNLAWAQATEPAELAVHPKTVEIQGHALQRNGAGIRTKAIFKVYSAALYLEKPASTLEEIAALPGAKRVSVSMLRNINASELGKLFAHGMEDNMDKQQFSKLIPGVMRMSDVFSRHKELKTGDKFTLDWIPGKGMLLSVNGTPEPSEFTEPAFYQAMLGIWLGPKPADTKLKQALLGEDRN
ncbi:MULTISPECIES: chalcone isomerase family protein [Comamonas]|uniref:chalcone isomerase family protein n=1 Tax=Comamonas TaxID=283 RepID=UPI00257AF742|nr:MULTISPECIES: chalcone isomerase family protein [Comamonas]